MAEPPTEAANTGQDAHLVSAESGFSYREGLLFLTGIAYFFLARKFAEDVAVFPAASVLTVICMAIAITLLAVAALRLVVPPRFLTYAFIATLLICSVFDYMTASQFRVPPSDEVAITADAAQAVATGHNPYTVDYRAVDPLLAKQPSWFFTPTFSGQRVAKYAYPAGTVVLLAPFVAFFGTGGLTHLYQLLFLLSALIAWLLVPPEVRPIVTIVTVLQTFAEVGGGSIDTLWLPFMLVAVWRWPRFVQADCSLVLRLLGPAALGMACSMKQNAWIIAPFLLLGIAVEAHANGRRWLRLVAAYAATAGGVFVAVNAPFMAADLPAWAKTVVAPFTLHTLIDGDGVSLIPLSGIAGGDHLELLGVAAGVALVAALLFVFVYFDRARRVLPLLAIVPLTVSTRSLTSYLDFLLLPTILAATVSAWAPLRLPSPTLRRRIRQAAVGAGIAAVAIVVFTLTQSPPLQVRVVATEVSGRTWKSSTVVVNNRTGRAFTPSFFAAPRGSINFTLTRVDGPVVLTAGASAQYRLAPLPTDQGLGAGDQVRIVALGDLPESISQSDPFVIGGPSAAPDLFPRR